MKSLKHSLFALSQECIDGSYEGWRGGQDAPTLDDVEYLGAQWYRRVSAGFLFAHLDGVVDIDEHVAARARIVEVLANYKVALADSRRRALDMLVDSYPLLSGTNDELVNRLGIAPDELGKVESAVVEDVALDLLLHDQHRIHYLLRLTLMLTQGYRRFRHEDIDEIQCDDEEVTSLAGQVHNTWRRRFKVPFMVALPHGPMSTLTRESANLGEIVRSKGDAGWREAGAKKGTDAKDRQLALIFDQSLVLKENGVEDTYLQIPLQGSLDEGLDAVGAITSLLKRKYQETTKKEATEKSIGGRIDDIPRVVAGMFRVAAMDQKLEFINKGEFVDSVSGIRLAEQIGLNPGLQSSRNRVAAVRTFLESIEISRSVRGENGKSVTWTGPIIQRLKDTVDVSSELPDRINRAKMELGVWRIAPELWRMQDPEGKSASFMLLDDRAFSLSASLSGPFNLYWTIIQRAYNARRAKDDKDRFDANGTFHPTFETLYKWSGVEAKTDLKNPARALERLQNYLDLLVEHELIEAYDSAIFNLSRFSLKNDVRRRVSITLPPSLLGYLAPASFLGDKNTFAASHRLTR